ncbi:hypothetical protein [Streptomyces sp. MP131-18]|uniref:hypothetical protein n=1 Tax=Streptomyces sp. MP131-18 TaxID=1857892 RepID=UPI00097BD44D|nr:hypothetical protein [Streptomyces sp. MP131-18]ONK09420.1 hypothetical protein STBA_01200 [Streptomyces sp. MP131-18]
MPARRLTAEQVAAARRRYAARDATWAQLGAEFDVALSTIKAAVTGRSWAHLTEPPPVRRGTPTPGGPGRARALTPLSVRDIIRTRRETSLTWQQIGALYGVHASVAYRAYRAATDAGRTVPPVPRPRRSTRTRADIARDRDAARAELRRLWSTATSAREVARAVGRSDAWVSRTARDMGLPPLRAARQPA